MPTPKRKSTVRQASSSRRRCERHRNQRHASSRDSTATLIHKRTGTAMWIKIQFGAAMTQTAFPADLFIVYFNFRCFQLERSVRGAVLPEGA